MPRKVQSSGESTQGRKTSARRAATTGIKDGGKWAGSGAKTVEHSQRPEIARQKQTGLGAKTRDAKRSAKVNHPNHG